MGQRNALAELLFSQPQRPTPNSLAALVGNADADLRAGIGTAQPRDPTWRERAGGLLQDALEKLSVDRYGARKIAQTIVGGESSNLPLRMGLLDPTAVGALFSRQESPNMGPGAPSGMLNAGLAGALKRGDRSAYSDLISSQSYLDRDMVAKKIRGGIFDVRVSPPFELDGRMVRTIEDGHHALEAAVRSGNRPNFITQTPTQNDRLLILDRGDVDGFLEASQNDSPWRWWSTNREIW